jgi:hypothetical protein
MDAQFLGEIGVVCLLPEQIRDASEKLSHEGALQNLFGIRTKKEAVTEALVEYIRRRG